MLRFAVAATCSMLPGCSDDPGAAGRDERAAPAGEVTLEAIGTYRAGAFMTGAAEIVDYDPATRSLFVVNAQSNTIDILSIERPDSPRLRRSIDLGPHGGGVNSVAVRPGGGLIAAAVEARVQTDRGSVVLFDTTGELIASVPVGVLPDMVIFTPDGRRILTADEGQPSDDYSIDPEGTITIIDLPEDPRDLDGTHTRTADFRRFNGRPVPEGMRVTGPNATVAQDLEPEYIGVSPDSATAWVTLQENNAIAVVDVATATVTRLIPLGYKDHAGENAGLDASDRDGRINIAPAPVLGMYQPDTIRAAEIGGGVYLFSADEGDPRAYGGFDEVARVKHLTLDPAAFPDAKALRRDDRIGRLEVSRVMGDEDNDGRHERLYAFGGRGFSIRDAEGRLVYESGDALERLTAEHFAEGFNSDNDEIEAFDTRSDNRGPEPEAVAVGRLGDRVLAFVGLERTGGIAIFDVTDPAATRPVGYSTTRVYGADPARNEAGDLGPESLCFIPASDSPTGETLLVSANEISGTVTVFRVR